MDLTTRTSTRSFPQSSFVRSLLVAVTAALVTAAPLSAAFAPPEDAMAKERLQAMLTAGDDGMVVATFKRFPGLTLPFIDSYLEGGLAMIEKGGQAALADAQQSFRMGIRFAKLADQAFGGTDFSDYANAFASWSASEQTSFREGQKLFRESRKLKDDPAKATELLERSLRLTEALNDTWGQIMAQSALGALYLAAGGEENLVKADQASRMAVTLARKVRLDEDRVSGLQLMSQVMKARGAKPEQRVTVLQEAWMLLRRDLSMDAKLRDAVAEELATLFSEMKRDDAAAEIRKEAASLKPAAPAGQ